MSGVKFEDFINFKRFTHFTSIVQLILYLPFGILLGILRVSIFLHAILIFRILPERFPFKRGILRTMLTVAGLPISVHGHTRLDNKKVLVSNSVTNLDPFILAILGTNTMVQEGQIVKDSSQLVQCYTLPADENHDQQIRLLKMKLSDSKEPLLFFPEKLKTNGKVSLLKFSDLPFELDSPIQPVTIQTSRFLFDISVSTLSSKTFEDIFWCLILPFTLITVKFLPVTERKSEESSAEFSSRVQSNMAKSMGVSSSSHISHDVIDYFKSRSLHQAEERVGHEPAVIKAASPEPFRQSAPTTTLDGEEDEDIKNLLKQVKTVFPDMPPQGIISDLKKTRDVDVTITNILEGKMESVSQEKPTKKSQAEMSFKASKFETNASKRQLSFSERKQVMLEAARREYKLKHGLL